jgi:hypothetical protein
MSIEESGYLVLGIAGNGHKFRPSDWVERIAAIYADFDAGRRLQYSPMVRPASHEGQKCLFVSSELASKDAAAFRYVMEFASSNHLKVISVGEPDSHLPTDELRHVA